VPVAPCPVTGHHCKELGNNKLSLEIEYKYKYIMNIKK